MEVPEKWESASGKCKAGNEGCQIVLIFMVGCCATAFAQDGKVDMPLTPTFWSPLYGMLTDKFGVGWMVMVAG